MGTTTELQEFRLTFGLRYADEPHPSFPDANPHGWVTVKAPDYESARTLVVDRIGPYWAFLYPADKFRSAPYRAGEIACWSSADPEPIAPIAADDASKPPSPGREVAPVTGLRLYCWECKGVHVLELADVERVVYALSLQVTENAAYIVTPDPPCPLVVLAEAVAGRYYQAVELSIGRREEADEWGLEQRKRLDGLDQLLQQRDTAAEAVLAIHTPCHTIESKPWDCEWHADPETGIPDRPACCMSCTYDDRTVGYPCPTVQALRPAEVPF